MLPSRIPLSAREAIRGELDQRDGTRPTQARYPSDPKAGIPKQPNRRICHNLAAPCAPRMRRCHRSN
jgi:hypothetical protein